MLFVLHHTLSKSNTQKPLIIVNYTELCKINCGTEQGYLAGLNIPHSNYALIITACYNILWVLVPAKAAEFRSGSHFNNWAVDIWWLVNNLRSRISQIWVNWILFMGLWLTQVPWRSSLTVENSKTLIRFETPAVANSSSSRSNSILHWRNIKTIFIFHVHEGLHTIKRNAVTYAPSS
jgi:hypothetical protein